MVVNEPCELDLFTNDLPSVPICSTRGNERGTLAMAKLGGDPDSGTTNWFINLADNSRLDSMGFAPFGKIIKGLDVVDKLTNKYGEMPQQGQIQAEGNAYLKKNFPDMDFIKKATIVPLQK